MECRKFVITLVSAENLPDVRSIGRMKVYATVSFVGESNTTIKTTVDKEGVTNPTWNFAAEYTIFESAVEQPGANLVVKLFSERTLGDRFIGEVYIPVKSLFDMGLDAENILRYNVEGTPNGVLNFYYSFGEKVLVPKESAWKKALEFGLTVLVEGAQILFGDD